jgi:hypothetical protein
LVYDLDRAVQIFKAVPSLAQKLIVKSEPSSAQQPTMWRRAEKSFGGKLPPNAGWQSVLWSICSGRWLLASSGMLGWPLCVLRNSASDAQFTNFM